MMIRTRTGRPLGALGDWDYTKTTFTNVTQLCNTAGCVIDVPASTGMTCENDPDLRTLIQYGYTCSAPAGGDTFAEWAYDPTRSTVYSASGQLAAPPSPTVVAYAQSLCPDAAPWNCSADVTLPQPGSCPPIAGLQVVQSGPQTCHYYKHTLADMLSGCTSTCAAPKPCDPAAAAAIGYQIYSMDGNSPVGGGNCWYHKIGTPLPVQATEMVAPVTPAPITGAIPAAPAAIGQPLATMMDTLTGGPAGADWISGIPNKYLIIGGAALAALVLLGGRR